MDSLELSNPAIGAGSQQIFRWTVLEWTPARNVFEMWSGQELQAMRGLIASLQQQVAQLKQQLASRPGPSATPPA